VKVDDSLNPFALTPSSSIDNLIIVDRETDMITPLLTQLTYEGLVDEIFGIQNCELKPLLLYLHWLTCDFTAKVELDTSITGNAQQNNHASSNPNPNQSGATGKKRLVALDSSDKLYEDLRDTN